ncbi:MAG: hypothetical protein AAF804_05015, partial [Bacteroidota bacterium]
MRIFTHLLILVLLLGGRISAQNLAVDLGAELQYVCKDSSLTLTPTITGAQGTLSYLWSTGSQASSLTVTALPADILIWVRVEDQSGTLATDTVSIEVLPECVLPGDANGDRNANNSDLLVMGLGFGDTGPVRPGASSNFDFQGAPAWGNLAWGGADQVHSDADGNGSVDWGDISTLAQNYSGPQTIDTTNWDANQGIPLYLDILNGVVTAGDTVHIKVMVGTPSNPVSGLHGLAFSLKYDLALVDSGSISLDYSNNWLGNVGTDAAAVDRVFYQDQQIDVGLTRLDQINRQGYGLMVDITVVIDDISGKKEAIEMLAIQLSNIILVDSQGQSLSVAPVGSEIAVSTNQETTNLALESDAPPLMSLYPVPAKEEIAVSWQAEEKATAFIFDQLGKTKAIMPLNGVETQRIDLRSWSPGIYSVQIR